MQLVLKVEPKILLVLTLTLKRFLDIGQALLVLDVVFPLLVHSASQELYGPAMVSVFQSLLQVDSTYLKMAKSLLVAQFPGTVLRLVASLIERTLANYSR